MRTALLAAISLVLAGLGTARAAATTASAGLRPADAVERAKEKGEDKEGAKERGKEKGKAASAGNKVAAPASKNLEVPGDLPEPVRKALEEAIGAFRDAEKATSGRAALLGKAISKLKAASSKAPKSPLPLYYLGIVYQWKRNFPQAKTFLEKALKLSPSFHEAQVKLADVHVWQKKLEESLPLYDKALELEPRYVPGQERKGLALIRLGRFADAKKHMSLALKGEPTPFRAELLKAIDREIQGPGWKETFAEETENYKVVTSVSQEYAREIARHAELIRRAYNVVFSDIDKPDRKYEIWVYESLDAYHAAGGPRMALGHYDPFFRKLVVPRQKKKEGTLSTLYHEAFHQYLHDYLEVAPQWFNEGLGDYFGAFQYDRIGEREVMRSRPDKGRLQNAQFAIDQKILPTAEDLMLMSREEMYDPKMGSFHYAQAWGMIYFMIEGNKPAYKRVLVSYFGALRKGLDLDEAYKTTFGRIDMRKFDAEWKGFIANHGL
ncbi:MAG: DUF1570 domain-containing protein [Planctomycetes bacterium]|nr:DUF1570 domain-containing protein [Planctomycetota bacterium]